MYTESLGDRLGLYKDPYSRFGQLTYDMWRAVRLVVDTGIHAKHWTRQQAIDYFKANAAKTEQDIINEVDRYISWPGQALAYKIGQLRILRAARRKREARLGRSSTSATSTTWCCRTAPCRWMCWKSRCGAGSRVSH